MAALSSQIENIPHLWDTTPRLTVLLLILKIIIMTTASAQIIPHRLTVVTNGRVDIINLQELVRIEAKSNYSKLFMANGNTLLVSKVLKKFDEQLGNGLFVRIHKTHLVNLSFIRAFHGSRNKTVLLENGENIEVSRSKQGYVMRKILEEFN